MGRPQLALVIRQRPERRRNRIRGLSIQVELERLLYALGRGRVTPLTPEQLERAKGAVQALSWVLRPKVMARPTKTILGALVDDLDD